MSTQRVSLFYAYADIDESLCLELDKHLSLLRRDGVITTFHRRSVKAGTDWTKEVDERLNRASIVLLLISVDFIASDYCYGVEMQRAMNRHKAGEARVIPVLLRPVANWQGTGFGNLQVLPSNGKPVANWPSQDDAFVDIAEGIRAVLQDMEAMPVHTPSLTLPPVWNIPYPRNPYFTGRDELLDHLSTAVKAGQAVALSQAQAISGLGGIGKTQVAVEYAYRHRNEYEAVLWVHAATRESLVSGYITLAEKLHLPQRSEQDQQIVINAVKNWLQTHISWLLILDNADDLSLAYEFLPPTYGGHLLLTTRAQATGTRAERLEVEKMLPEVGALFLLRRAKLIGAHAPLDHVNPADIAVAREITNELGGLPLALDQAGAYIEESQCCLQEYRDLYRVRRAELLKERGGPVEDHPEPVATTWSISFANVEEKNPAAADLLRLCAFLAPDVIPEELITRGAQHLGSQLQSFGSDPLALRKVIGTLGAYSLIRRNAQEKVLSVHRLVQAVQRDAMDEPTQKVWAERAVLAVNEVFPEVEFTMWPQCERYFPHALACATTIEQEHLMYLPGASLLTRLGWYLRDRASYEKAEQVLKRALSIQEEMLGPKHQMVGRAVNELAHLSFKQGKFEEAEALYERCLSICEGQPIRVPSHLVAVLNNLADTCRVRTKYEKALKLFQRALALCELYGGEYLGTAKVLCNLGILYMEQGKDKEAELLFKRALSIRELQLGAMHPDTATSLNNLADLYRRRGKYTDSEQLFKRALVIDEKVYGLDHPEVATDLHNLAMLYGVQGRGWEAEEYFKRAYQIFEEALGRSHPNTNTVQREYVALLRKQGREEEARALEEPAELK